MTPQQLIERLLDQRRAWVDVSPHLRLPEGSVRVRYLRPAESEYGTFRGKSWADIAVQCVDGWSGVTEAVLLGSAVGAATEVAFDRALWETWVRDQSAMAAAVTSEIGTAVSAHIEARAAAAKN